MLFLVIFFVVLAGLAAFVCLVVIKIAFEYVRSDEDDNFVLSFYTMKGIFKYKYEIPLIDRGTSSVKFKLVKEQGKKEKNVGQRKERLHIGEFIDKIVSLREFCIKNNDVTCFIRKILYEKVLLVDFRLKVKEGTGDAFYTGMLSGLLWSVAGFVTSYLSNNFRNMKKSVSINPSFNAKVFNVNFVCIFHVRFVHIIMVIVRVLIRRHKLQFAEKVIGGGMSGRAASN